jgi:hypothetical protein
MAGTPIPFLYFQRRYIVSSLNRFLRSRTGMISIVLVFVLVIAAIVILRPDTSTGPGTIFPPAGGYTCMPSACPVSGETIDWATFQADGKFFSLPGEQLVSFEGAPVIVWITVPAGEADFELGFFDGDSGKNASGQLNWQQGHWDNVTTDATYILYADPLKDGSGSKVVAQWTANGTLAASGNNGNGSWTAKNGATAMPNNNWYDVTVQTNIAARSFVAQNNSNSGNFVYRLEATRPLAGNGINAFKLRSDGYLSTGRHGLVESTFSIVGMLNGTANDMAVLHPGWQLSQGYAALQNHPTTYSGEWEFYIYVPNDSVSLEIWDGDFDRGGNTAARDNDDANTENVVPAFATGTTARPEGAQGIGAPADDSPFWLYRRSPAVYYEVIDPQGDPILTNQEPTGTSEWERYAVSTDASIADTNAVVASIEPGMYRLRLVGLDLHNTVWLRGNFELCSDARSCTPCPEGTNCTFSTCPRTIGYWKNNVKKVLIDNKTNGVQESKDSIRAALEAIAQVSPLYRAGINVANPVAIGTAARLTDQEAHAILQKSAGNTMLDRALQQNLATWLNVASGKLSADAVLSLNSAGVTFNGTVWEALLANQDVILNQRGDAAALERAKTIADLINNGLLGEDAETSTCGDYTTVIPPDQQPPDRDDVPNPTPVPTATSAPVVPDPDNSVCTGNMQGYQIENTTNNPFYGVKFNVSGGQEIKGGDTDVYVITVSADTAAAMTANGVQLEAKAGTLDETVTMSGCDFSGTVMCGPISSSSGGFAWTFMGASTNADGSVSMTFQVQNFDNSGLSHATIGLPAGATASICQP